MNQVFFSHYPKIVIRCSLFFDNSCADVLLCLINTYTLMDCRLGSSRHFGYWTM